MVLWQKGQFSFLCLIMKETVTNRVFYAKFHHGKKFFLSQPVGEIACEEGVLFALKIMIQQFNVHRTERVRDLTRLGQARPLLLLRPTALAYKPSKHFTQLNTINGP